MERRSSDAHLDRLADRVIAGAAAIRPFRAEAGDGESRVHLVEHPALADRSDLPLRIEDKFGVRITDIVNPTERVARLR